MNARKIYRSRLITANVLLTELNELIDGQNGNFPPSPSGSVGRIDLAGHARGKSPEVVGDPLLFGGRQTREPMPGNVVDAVFKNTQT